MQKLEDDLKKAMATIDIVNVGAESSAGKPEQARETTNPAARRLHRIVLDITGLIRRTGSYIGLMITMTLWPFVLSSIFLPH